MKSNILCACLVCMLFVPTVTLGEVWFVDDHWEGEGDVWGYYASSNASAYADGDEVWEYSSAEGGYALQTTEGGSCDWWYYYEASAYVYASRTDTDTVVACAGGMANGTKGTGVSAQASVFIPYPWPSDSDSDEPDAETDEGTDEFDPYEKINASHEVYAEALTAEQGSSNWAVAYGDAGACIDLSEN